MGETLIWPPCPRGELEWDQANDPWMINKTVPCVIADMTGAYCPGVHVDSWGHRHNCIRLRDHTGRHCSANFSGRYIMAVWK